MPATDTLRAEIEREHREISSLLRKLEESGDPLGLAPVLAELRPLLETHFAREEADDGLHDTIGETAPNLLPSVHELFEEHGEMRTAIHSLCERSNQLAQLADEVVEGTRLLIADLRAHEAREDDLFGHAVYDVIGAGD